MQGRTQSQLDKQQRTQEETVYDSSHGKSAKSPKQKPYLSETVTKPCNKDYVQGVQEEQPKKQQEQHKKREKQTFSFSLSLSLALSTHT